MIKPRFRTMSPAVNDKDLRKDVEDFLSFNEGNYNIHELMDSIIRGIDKYDLNAAYVSVEEDGSRIFGSVNTGRYIESIFYGDDLVVYVFVSDNFVTQRKHRQVIKLPYGELPKIDVFKFILLSYTPDGKGNLAYGIRHRDAFTGHKKTIDRLKEQGYYDRETFQAEHAQDTYRELYADYAKKFNAKNHKAAPYNTAEEARTTPDLSVRGINKELVNDCIKDIILFNYAHKDLYNVEPGESHVGDVVEDRLTENAVGAPMKVEMLGRSSPRVDISSLVMRRKFGSRGVLSLGDYRTFGCSVAMNNHSEVNVWVINDRQSVLFSTVITDAKSLRHALRIDYAQMIFKGILDFDPTAVDKQLNHELTPETIKKEVKQRLSSKSTDKYDLEEIASLEKEQDLLNRKYDKDLIDSRYYDSRSEIIQERIDSMREDIEARSEERHASILPLYKLAYNTFNAKNHAAAPYTKSED